MSSLPGWQISPVSFFFSFFFFYDVYVACACACVRRSRCLFHWSHSPSRSRPLGLKLDQDDRPHHPHHPHRLQNWFDLEHHLDLSHLEDHPESCRQSFLLNPGLPSRPSRPLLDLSQNLDPHPPLAHLVTTLRSHSLAHVAALHDLPDALESSIVCSLSGNDAFEWPFQKLAAPFHPTSLQPPRSLPSQVGSRRPSSLLSTFGAQLLEFPQCFPIQPPSNNGTFFGGVETLLEKETGEESSMIFSTKASLFV